MSATRFTRVGPSTSRVRRLPPGADRIAHALLIGLLLVWTLLPIAWLVVMATQPERNYVTAPLRIDVNEFSLRWIEIMLAKPEFIQAAANSVIIATVAMLLTVSLGTLAAYPLARMRIRGQGAFLAIVIASRLVPSMILIVPMFLVARSLRLLDTHVILIVVYTALLLPFATWLLKNYFEQVPRDIERAARMDGCSRLGALVRVVLPLSMPGIVATAVYMFISAWNSFVFGLVLTSRNARPITLVLSQQTGQGYQPDDPTISQLASAGILTVLPVLLLLVLLHKQLVRGLFPGTKG